MNSWRGQHKKGWIVSGKNKPMTTGDVVAAGEVTMNDIPSVIRAGYPLLSSPHKAARKDAALEGQLLRTPYRPGDQPTTSPPRCC